MKIHSRSTTIWIFSLLATAGLSAQTGELSGAVTGADGLGIPGVTVVINEAGMAGITGGDGSYEINNVPEGTYSLTYTLGSRVSTSEGVEITAGETTVSNFESDWEVSFAETITVYSASRRPERIVDAPAAITVVPAEEIEREASHGQVPKLLEFTPGAEVTQSGIYDYNLNTRGFNSSLNRRVATLVDGRDPSVPFLGAQEWAAVSFPLDDLQSLELLRGPSAALYGANASSGVLNLVTKRPKDSQGGTARITAGELDTLNADFRWAAALGRDWFVKFNGGLRDSGDFSRSRTTSVEYAVPCTATTTQECLPLETPLAIEDDNNISFYNLRLDRDFNNTKLLTLEAGNALVEGPLFQTGIGRVQLVDIERPWYRANFNTPHWNFLAFQSTRDAPEQKALSSGNNLALDTEKTQFEVQTNWDFADGDLRVVVGGASGSTDVDTLDPRTGRQTLIFAPLSADYSALFGQVDWAMTDKVKLVLAGRYDEHDLHDSQFSPKGSLVYSINDNHSLRFTYNEAFQVPNYSEFFLYVDVAAPITALAGVEKLLCAPFMVDCGLDFIRVLALGNETLGLEEVETFEVGYTGILGNNAFLTFEYYSSDNTNFITDLLPQFTALGVTNSNFGPYTPPADLPPPIQAQLLAILQANLGPSFFIMSNGPDGSPILVARSYTTFGQVDTEGADLGLTIHAGDGYRFDFSYSWFDFDIGSSAPGLDTLLSPNSPESKASFGISSVGERFDWGISGRWVDDFFWAVGPFQGTVKSYTTFDLNANYHFGDGWTFGVNVANLLDDEHWESFGGDLLGRRALASIAYEW